MDTATHATPASASPLAIVVMGVSGSGKTTIAQALAAHYGFRFLDADDYHSVAARAQMAAGQPLTDAMRLPWVELLSATLRDCVQAGESVVLAFSGLRSAHRQLLRNSGVPMRFVFLHAGPHVIAARLSARAGHFMPPCCSTARYKRWNCRWTKRMWSRWRWMPALLPWCRTRSPSWQRSIPLHCNMLHARRSACRSAQMTCMKREVISA